MKILLTFIVSFCLTSTLLSQYSQREWVAATSSPSGVTDDRAFKIVIDASGNSYITGQAHQSHNTYGIMTVKYDNSGSQVWMSSYSGTGNNNDSATGIALDAAGNVYVCGKHFNGSTFEYVVIKYDGSDGHQIWARGYTATASGGNAIPTGIAVENTGISGPNVYVTGYSLETTGHISGERANYDMLTIKYDSSGTQNWVNRFDAPDEPLEGNILGRADDYAFALALYDPPTLPRGYGKVFITGTSYHNFTEVHYSKLDNIVVQIDFLTGGDLSDPIYSYYNDGDLPVSGIEDAGLAIAVSQKWGKIYYTGYKHKDATTTDIFLTQNRLGLYNEIPHAHQDEDWCATYVNDLESNTCFRKIPDRGDDFANAIIETDGASSPSDNIIYICGSTHTIPDLRDTTNSFTASGSDFITIRYHGSVGNPINCGSGEDYENYMFDYKSGRFGMTPVLSTYDGSAHGNDAAYGLTFGPNGNIYVVGTSVETVGDGFQNRFTVIEYTSDLVQNWVDNYPRSTESNNNDAGGFGITANSSNIYAAGFGYTSSSGNDFTAIKYGLPGGSSTSKNGNLNSPYAYSLDQNYPNPFNPSTDISFSIKFKGFVKISVYDIMGREVTMLVNQEMEAGVHSVKWDATNFASGVYFYKISAGGFTATKKLLLIK